MSKAYRCDRCKDFYDEPLENETLNIRDLNRLLDICPKCYKQFMDWFNCYKNKPVPEENPLFSH